jgi:hypothetical protein
LKQNKSRISTKKTVSPTENILNTTLKTNKC